MYIGLISLLYAYIVTLLEKKVSLQVDLVEPSLHFESAQNYTDSGEITRGANAPSVFSQKIKTELF